jgi:hypothetical protein
VTKKLLRFGFIVTSVGVVAVVGCSNILTIPIPLNTGATLGGFDVVAGVPTQKTANFALQDVSIEAGGGNLEIPLDAISITPAGSGGGKLRPTQQGVSLCLTACLAANVDEDTCDNVCEENNLLITLHVGDTLATVCEEGDEYQAIVALDDDGNPTSVAVTPEQLSAETIGLLNSGANLAVCVEVLSPITGEVLIEEIILNVGI